MLTREQRDERFRNRRQRIQKLKGESPETTQRKTPAKKKDPYECDWRRSVGLNVIDKVDNTAGCGGKKTDQEAFLCMNPKVEEDRCMLMADCSRVKEIAKAGPYAVCKDCHHRRKTMFVRTEGEIVGQNYHRHGWPYAFPYLRKLKCGVLVDDFVEQTFCYAKKPRPHLVPWIGIFHHPPGGPDYFRPEHRPSEMFATPAFQESLTHLRAIVTLSEHGANYWRHKVSRPVFVVKHPVELDVPHWSPDKFATNENKQILQIGWYLRNTQLMFEFPPVDEFEKVRLINATKSPAQYDGEVRKHAKRAYIDQHVSIPSRYSNEEYDALLAQNIVCMELFDASATNVVLDCISRNTPLIVNRHPAVEEYLGNDYPLYFSSPQEIPSMLTGCRLLEAHKYLGVLDKSWCTGEAFLESLQSWVDELS